MEGLKNDKEKPRYDLLPSGAIDELAKVLTHGANKYEEHGWRNVKNGKERYLSALLRHAFALVGGEEFDNDSKLHHAAHIMANAAFLLELSREKQELSSEHFDHPGDFINLTVNTGKDFCVYRSDNNIRIASASPSINEILNNCKKDKEPRKDEHCTHRYSINRSSMFLSYPPKYEGLCIICGEHKFFTEEEARMSKPSEKCNHQYNRGICLNCGDENVFGGNKL